MRPRQTREEPANKEGSALNLPEALAGLFTLGLFI